MVSIAAVAKAAKVSTATVSRALSGSSAVSDATRRHVESVARELGYIMSSSASSLASGRTKNVGVLIPYLERWYFSTVLSGISAALASFGYDLTLYYTSNNPAERATVFRDLLRRQRVDAFISVALEFSDEETDTLQALGKPVVAVGGETPKSTNLTINQADLATLATNHLIRLGHTRIAHIGAGTEFDLDFHVPTQRRVGYEKALKDAGITPDQSMYRAADFTAPGAYHAAKQLLGNPRTAPTALYVASDEMAIGAMQAARDLGLRIPEDISIIGVDGHGLGELFQLTTIDQFPHEQGKRAVQRIMHLLGIVKEAPTSKLPYELVVRGSTQRLSTQ